MTATFTGGKKMAEKLKETIDKMKSANLVKVGFFEGSIETKSGVSTPMVAYANEFGAAIPARTVAAHTSKIYRRVNKKGQFLNQAKFVKRGKSNFETSVQIPEHVIPAHNIPARPFFRRMISLGKAHWGSDVAASLKITKYDAQKTMDTIGQQMVDELQQSIGERAYTPLAASTIRAKGNDQTLIDSGDMQNAVAFQVE